MEVETITQEEETETRLQKAFERMIEIKQQKNVLEQEEQQIKDDAFDYLRRTSLIPIPLYSFFQR